jgi:23S rRNA (uracil1939-C5)-methyltransferase
LGLFARGSHQVIDIEGCRVLSPRVAEASEALRRLLPLPIYGADIRETSEGMLITLLSEHDDVRDELSRVARELVQSGAAVSVAISVRPSSSFRLLAGTPEVVAGPHSARHQLDGAPYSYAAHGAFVQAHAGQTAYLYSEIQRGLSERLGGLGGRRVLELFAGSGALALLLAQYGAELTAVEAYPPAMALAKRAAQEQRLGVSCTVSDAEQFILREREHALYDAVIVNPPRRGLSPGLRRALAELRPKTLVYVSCQPETLARDLAQLRILGLNPELAEPLDMIPWSDAIEALCWLAPAEPPLPVPLFESEHWLAVAKPAHEPVENGRGLYGLVRRVQRLPGCEAATPLDLLPQGASGVCWFARRPESLTDARALVAGADSELLALVRGYTRKRGQLRRPSSRSNGSDTPLGYERVAVHGRHSLLQLSPGAGALDGLGRQLSAIGHPLLGDERGDPRSNEFLGHRHGLDRPFLHRSRMTLTLPSGERLSAEAPLAPDLCAVLSSIDSDQAASSGG